MAATATGAGAYGSRSPTSSPGSLERECADDEVCGEVRVRFSSGRIDRVRRVEVAGERAERERGGSAVGQQEVEAACRHGVRSSFGREVGEQAARRLERGLDVGVVDVGEPWCVLAARGGRARGGLACCSSAFARCWSRPHTVSTDSGGCQYLFARC